MKSFPVISVFASGRVKAVVQALFLCCCTLSTGFVAAFAASPAAPAPESASGIHHEEREMPVFRAGYGTSETQVRIPNNRFDGDDSDCAELAPLGDIPHFVRVEVRRFDRAERGIS